MRRQFGILLADASPQRQADGTWRVIAPTAPGPQPWGTGGDMEMCIAIRTLLSFTLELEVSGRWPWQRARAAAPTPAFAGA